MAVDQAQQWLPDPAGRHQYRLYSDGHPTEWVSDSGSMTVDPLGAPGAGSVGTVQAEVTRGGSGSSSPTPPNGTRPSTTPARPAGWYRNAANPDEVRYWDGSGWAVDDTGATPVLETAPARAAAPAAPAVPTALAAPATPQAPPPDTTPPRATGRRATDVIVDTPGRHSLGRTRSAAPVDAPAVAPAPAPIPGPTGAGGDRTSPAVPPATNGNGSAGSVPAGRTAAAVRPADWYPDPSDRTRLRYWDGGGWTEHVLDAPPAHPSPPAGPPAA